MTDEVKESIVGRWIDNKLTSKKSATEKHPLHYYGDGVRRMFFSAGIIMLVGLPFFAQNLELTVFVATLGVIGVGIFAGLTSPRNRGIMIFDVCVSAGASIVFELLAIDWFKKNGGPDMYFFFNQALAVLFFVALYFSVKTFRAMISTGEVEEEKGSSRR